MTFKVYIRRGRYLTALRESPDFRDRDEASAWAEHFLRSNPDRIERGLEGIAVASTDDPAIVRGPTDGR